jgi:hypothetical protein
VEEGVGRSREQLESAEEQHGYVSKRCAKKTMLSRVVEFVARLSPVRLLPPLLLWLLQLRLVLQRHCRDQEQFGG